MSIAHSVSRTSSLPTARYIRHHALSLNSLPGQWRRFTMSSVNNNTRFTHDFWLTLEAFRPTEEQLGATLQLQERLRNIVQTRFGRDFDVHYVGLGSFATGLRGEKHEFAIVDSKVERGEVGKVYLENLPPAYDPTHVSQILLEEGFNDTTEDSTFVSAAIQDPPSPAYNHTPCREIIYPVKLSGRRPVVFDLLLPGPTIMPLVRLLSAYGHVMKGVSETISVFYLWLKSHEMHQISPVCAALLFIGFLQENCNFPCLTSSTDILNGEKYKAALASGDTGRWVLYKYLLRSAQHDSEREAERILLETAFVNEPVCSKEGRFDPANIFAKFMDYCSRILQNARSSVTSVHSGIRVERQHQYVGGHPVDLNLMERQCVGAYSPGIQPPMWKLHPLIVQDPFVHTHNHAQCVSETTLISLQKQASLVQAAVASGYSLKSTFGPRLKFPSFSHLAQRRSDLISTLSASCPPEISQPPQYSVLKARSLTINRVENVIQKVYGSRFRVKAFGSTVYGLDNASSDMDLVVLDPDRKQGFPNKASLKKLPHVYKINRLAGEMKRAKFKKVLSISGAKVPIVKFLDPATGIHCDLNVNDRLGLINSALVKQYLDLQPISRPLIRSIKLWAKSIGMNSPSGATVVSFSSYALTLMTIAFFQTKGWLPNLQDLPPLNSDELHGTFWLKGKKGILRQCDVRYLELEWWPLVDMKLEDLLLQWFRFWGREFGYATDIVFIRHGGVVPRQDRYKLTTGRIKRSKQIKTVNLDQSILADLLGPVGEADSSYVEGFDDNTREIDEDVTDIDDDAKLGFRSSWTVNPLCVIDPFDTRKNCCQNIVLSTVVQFIEHCRSAEELVTRSGFSLHDLISDFRVARSENRKGKKSKKANN